MAKKDTEFPTDKPDEYSGDDKSVTKFQASPKSAPTVKLTSKQNRTIELYIGRSVFTFAPFAHHVVPESVINHPDFKSEKDKFSISFEGKR